jgi:hypothetical protein
VLVDCRERVRANEASLCLNYLRFFIGIKSLKRRHPSRVTLLLHCWPVLKVEKMSLDRQEQQRLRAALRKW